MVRKKEQYVSEAVRKERRKLRLRRLATTLFTIAMVLALISIWIPNEVAASKTLLSAIPFVISSVVSALAALD